MIRCIAHGIAVFAFISASAAADPVRAAEAARDAIDGSAFSGSIAVAGSGALTTALAGFADRESGLPVGAETLFNIASVGKVFTAAALDRELHARGLDFSAPVAAFGERWAALFEPDVTAGDLLSHSAVPIELTAEDFFAAGSNAELAARAADLQTGRIAHGDTPYSNTNYVFAGELAAELAGTTYEALIVNMFHDAGVEDFAFARMDDADTLGLAIGYTGGESPGRTQDPLARARSSAAGGLYMTAEALAAAGAALMDGRIGAPEALSRMCTPLKPMGPGHAGYGCVIMTGEGLTVYGHGGGAPGAFADLRFYPDQGTVFAITANAGADATLPVRAFHQAMATAARNAAD